MRKTAALLLLALLATAADARGQVADAALKDRVAQLVEKLDAPKADDRDAAEASLVKLGARALPLLPNPAKGDSAEKKARLEKVRQAIAEEQEKTSFEASKVTIKGQGVRLTEAVKQLQIQSGNVITDLREQFGADATNPALDLEIEGQPFFEALDLVARKAGVIANPYTGDGSIGLMAGGDADKPDQIGEPPFVPLVAYSGPFRVTFKQVLIQKNLQTGAATANAQFDVGWEPRLRPMLLSLKADNVAIVDDRGNSVLPSVSDESGNVVLRQENPVIEMNVNMDAPSRDARKLASFKVKAELTVPAAVRTFKFPSLAARNAQQKQGDIGVTMEDTEVEETTWKVRVNLAMPGEGPAFESYRQGLFNNRIWLQRADGSRYDHSGDHGGGFNQYGGGGGELGFEYLFVDIPGKPADYQLFYETPGKVVPIPLEFEFKDVPLP